MSLSLAEYADRLDKRAHLAWPAAPVADPPRARPHLTYLHGVKAVLWNVYGTLLAIPLGELAFEHPHPFIMSNALERTIQEFNMWGSMSRKPGQPSEYMGHIYSQILLEQRSGPPGERYPEVAVERVWEAILKRLIQKGYKWDLADLGPLNELSRKVAYFFHASLQGTACYEGAANALRHVKKAGLFQGLLGDGQCFTTLQLGRALRAQDATTPEGPAVLSHECRGRKPSDRLFRAALDPLIATGLTPGEILHVGSSIQRDLVPARRLGMKTALFAGDKTSLQATAEQLKDPASRPDVMLTELEQIAEVVG